MTPQLLKEDAGLTARRPPGPAAIPASHPEMRAWRGIFWFGLLLSMVGISDIALSWYPLALGSPEWEFGTVAISVGGLPLTTMGLAAMLGSALARGRSRTLVTLGIASAVLALLVLAAYFLFITSAPMALRAAPEAGVLTVKKMIVRTSILCIGFSVSYVVAALTALRHAIPKKRR